MKLLLITRSLIFWLAIAFLLITIFSLTVGQKIPIEFADWRVMHKYYDTIFQYFPFAILLTLLRTLKKKYSSLKNGIIAGATILISFFTFFMLGALAFSIGFGAWVNESVLYRNKKNAAITINEQIYDVGALGYGGRRTVRLKPFLRYWNCVERVDVSKLHATEWMEIKSDLYQP